MDPFKNLSLAKKFGYGVGAIMLVTAITTVYIFFVLQSTSSKIILMSLVGLIVLLVAVVSVYIIRSVSLPAVQLMRKTREVAAGRLNTLIDINSTDELGQLAKAFNEMTARLQFTMQGLVDKSEKLAQGKAQDEAILGSIGDGLIVTDQQGKIIMLNNAAQGILGWQLKEILGQSLVDVMPLITEDGQPIAKQQQPLSQALGQGKKIIASSKVLRKDKTSFIAGMTFAPFIINGRIVGAVEVFRDISREKEIDKAKSEFVSLASHQLKTPLSSINWYTEMLSDGDAGKLTKKQADYLEKIYSSSQNMVALVNSLLNVSRIELETFAVDPEPTRVEEVAKNILKELKPQIQKAKLKLSTAYAKALPIIQADPKLLRMIFQNLLTNAIKYTPAGGKISLKIYLDTAQAFGEKSGNIMITIADTGYGIPKNQSQKIFTKLFRADNVKTRQPDGTGLGLYLVKSILTKTGGDVWFNSEQDKGTTFFVAIPLSGMAQKQGSKKLN